MTVADLIKRLQAMPQDSTVEIWGYEMGKEDSDICYAPEYVEALREEQDDGTEVIATVLWGTLVKEEGGI